MRRALETPRYCSKKILFNDMPYEVLWMREQRTRNCWVCAVI